MGIPLSTIECIACEGSGKYPSYRECYTCYGTGYQHSVKGEIMYVYSLVKRKLIKIY